MTTALSLLVMLATYVGVVGLLVFLAWLDGIPLRASELACMTLWPMVPLVMMLENKRRRTRVQRLLGDVPGAKVVRR